MKTHARRRKTKETGGDDLWEWAGRRDIPAVREEPGEPARADWYRGFLKKLSGQKDGS